MLGLCAGGIVLSTVVAHLAAQGRAGPDRRADARRDACSTTHNAGHDRRVHGRQRRRWPRRPTPPASGYLDGRSLAGVFAWLRPNDLIWNYWVSNYLLGKDPPAFDILFWNADTTNMPAALHRDFMRPRARERARPSRARRRCSARRSTSRRSRSTPTSSPGIADHITPWQNAYRTVHLLGSEPRFVLSTSGHIAALVNPPGNEKATFRVNDAAARGAGGVARRARRTTPGTWWDDWVGVAGRALGREEDAPARRSAARATSRSATRRAATCSSRRAARPRQRRPAALRAHAGPASRCC